MIEHNDNSTGDRLVRIVVGLAVAAVGAGVGFVLLFIGVVEATGCFFECRDPNYLVGVPALLGSSASFSVGVGALVWGFGGGSVRSVAKLVALLAAAGCVLMALGAVFG